jgi:Mg-chelatase subunit ChlD
VGVVEQVVDDHRIGLVTYHDAAAARVALSPRLAKLRETLLNVSPAGGGDMPEGVDKALDVALTPQFGWRKRSEKTVVIVGDAPMHAADVQPTMRRVAAMHSELGMRFNTVSTGGQLVPELEELAKQGGGRALQLKQTQQLVSEVLLLIFGEPLRPAMERFVPVLLEVLQAARAG